MGNETLSAGLPFIEKLNRLMERRKQKYSKLGIAFLNEFNKEDDPKIKIIWETWTRKVNQVNIKFLEQGQKFGMISEKIKPEVFLFFIRKRNELLVDSELKKSALTPKSDLKS